jgi:hypothetical protein
VFLNNDTVVPPGWLAALVAPLRDPALGAVNPVTNRIGTPAEVGAHGDGTYGAFLKRAAERASEQAGVLRPVRMLALFCMALRRETWDRVGVLDEGFETGLFEDDDYSYRLGLAGLGMACAEGVLVHHFGEASFGDLVSDGRYGSLYRRNRDRFEEKWGVDSLPRETGRDPAYERLVERVKGEVGNRLPADATVAVVSRGDDRLLDLGLATAWHFPRGEAGVYAGHYPADGPEAIRQLENVREQGATHFLLPQTGFWWLEHYDELRAHLETSGGVMARSEDLILYRLDDSAKVSSRPDTGKERLPRPKEDASP